MTIIDASGATSPFGMNDAALFDYAFATLTGNPSTYGWQSTGFTRLQANGSGIANDPSGYPIAGSITELLLDLPVEDDTVDPSPDTDVVITLQQAVPLTDLVSPAGTTPALAADKFWETLLSGDDRLIGPVETGGFLFGDFLSIQSIPFQVEAKTGGDDFLSAAPALAAGPVIIGTRGLPAPALIGDAVDVGGSVFNNLLYEGRLTGGADTIRLSGAPTYVLVGDAYSVTQYGAVIGGVDSIRSDAQSIGFGINSPSVLVGDVHDNSGSVTGGRDAIVGSNYQFLNEFLAGDVMRQAAGQTSGGDDVINGRAGHDYIAGDVVAGVGIVTGGNDTLLGGEDSDIIAGDMLQAGGSGPFLRFLSADAPLVLTGGDDRILGEGGDDWISGDVWGVDAVPPRSALTGGDDLLDGGTGADLIYGDFGPDASTSIAMTGGGDTLRGGDGDDTLFGEGGFDRIEGGAGDDLYFVGVAADVVVEALNGGTDHVVSEATFTLSANVEILSLLGGNINGTGNALANALYGTGGANRLKGLAGADTMVGAEGDDIYVVDSAGDLVIEQAGEGIDLISSSVSRTLSAHVEKLALNGSANVNAFGNELANTLIGNSGNNILNGKLGKDTMLGGAGNDSFYFSDALGPTNVDLITDFVVADDTIRLDDSVFVGLAPGTLAAAAFHLGSAAADASDRIMYDSGNGRVYFDRDGTGGAYAAIHFATLDPGLALTRADFLIV
jgi:Ca2+-binding RTX toxin-like protein